MPRHLWQEEAACVGMPTDAFYGETNTHNVQADIALFARRICQPCPVIYDCALAALKNDEPFGVWAGATVMERKKALREHEGNIVESARSLVQQTMSLEGENHE